MMPLPWSRDDIPSGTGTFAIGFFLLVGAAVSLTSGRLGPGPYHQLVTKTSTVREVRHGGRSSAVSVVLDTFPASSALTLSDPEIGGAQALLWRLRRGARYDVTYDPWTQRIWEIEPVPSVSATSTNSDNRARSTVDVRFGPSEIAAWRVADQIAGRTRAEWFAGMGVLTLLVGIVQLVRSNPVDEAGGDS